MGYEAVIDKYWCWNKFLQVLGWRGGGITLEVVFLLRLQRSTAGAGSGEGGGGAKYKCGITFMSRLVNLTVPNKHSGSSSSAWPSSTTAVQR